MIKMITACNCRLGDEIMATALAKEFFFLGGDLLQLSLWLWGLCLVVIGLEHNSKQHLFGHVVFITRQLNT